MKYNRILLVRPPVRSGRNIIPGMPPLGLGYLAQMLQRNGIDYNIVDMTLGDGDQILYEHIKSYKPDLIGFSLMTFEYLESYKLITDIKTQFPQVDIIAGGPHVSTLRHVVLEDCTALDYGAVLEGEHTLLSLCQGETISSIKGLMHRLEGEVIYNGDPDFIKNLDSLGFPEYNGFDIEQYPLNRLGILTSRGCPYDCIYCPVHNAIGRKFRMRTPEHMLAEIKHWYERGYRVFDILDDNFTLHKKRVFKFIDLLRDNPMPGLTLYCNNGVRADRVSYEMLAAMKEVGFTELAFGVEAGNTKILNNLRKGEEIETIEAAIKAACDLGYHVQLFFLIGSPGESWQDFEDSLRLAEKYPVGEARFYNLIPFPNTALYRWVEENDYFTRDPAEYLNTANHYFNEPYFATPEFSLEDRRRAYELAQDVSRRVDRRFIARQLHKFGPLAHIGAYIASSERFRSFQRSNQTLKKMVGWTRSRLMYGH